MRSYYTRLLGYDDNTTNLAETIAAAIAAAIAADLSDRSGGLEFDDEILRNEIGPSWKAIIESKLRFLNLHND